MTHSNSAGKKLSFIAEIYCEFGSAFQSTAARDSLDVMLKEWVWFYSNTHKGNKLIVEYHEQPLRQPTDEKPQNP